MPLYGKKRDELRKCNKEAVFEALDHFASRGGNFIVAGSACRWAEEHTEIWVGEWIASRRNRDAMILATKVFMQPQCEHDYCNPVPKSHADWISQSLERSLTNLQTSYVDLFYVDGWNDGVAVSGLMTRLNATVVEDKVLYLGAADIPATVMAEANRYARNHGLPRFLVYQARWKAALRDFETDVIQLCREQELSVCPYIPMYPDIIHVTRRAEGIQRPLPGESTLSTDVKRVSCVLEEIACAKEITVVQVVLAYVLYKSPFVSLILGISSLDRLEEVDPAPAVFLTAAEAEKIESVYHPESAPSEAADTRLYSLYRDMARLLGY
jgi:aryl-alcohol dehydrogenase-like predicted oxidoreductase